MQLYRLSLLVVSFVSSVGAQSTFSPARPPAIPLAVRSPYLSTWLDVGSDGGNGGYLAGQWPVFWQNQVTGWAGLIRVDGNTYTWMGLPGSNTVNQTAFEYTSTKSIFTMNVENKIEMNITFLSPVTPTDLKRQSLVFSYLNVEVSSLDGQKHNVQVYADISAEWVSGDRNAIAEWEYGTTDGVAYHKVYRQTQLAFSEKNEQGEWGNWYWATDDSKGMTHQSGAATDVRGQFTRSGKLINGGDTNFRAISSTWPVFGFSSDLGLIDSTPVSTLFSLGLTQDEAVQYEGASNYAPVPSLWKSYFDTELAALSFFHQDHAESSNLASFFDSKVAQDSIATAGQDYLTITSLSVRQAFGATQLCGTKNQTYLFLKEISSDGNMNTVDVVFPAYPIFLYANPELLKLVLTPLFENQEAGKYPNKYSMHDLGSAYPNATGHSDGNDEKMPLEECGDMLIMSLAYAQKSGDSDFLNNHYALLKQWTSYLVEDSLYPANQISTDDFAGSLANQTNLALKGMIGIQAMAVIANQTGHTADAANYSSIAKDYITQWQDLAIAKNANPPRTTLSYGDTASHGLLYNIFADAQLGLNLVPQSVYQMQSDFYPTVANKYGVPLDTRHTYTKGDWECFAAAVSSVNTRTMFIKDLATWINETPTNRPLTDLYDTISGNYPQNTFIARPVIGGSFAPLIVS
ncbi:Glutaminase GtaA [Penicillium digitatum]|nr:Glutaminase GtaA [Penicillium digitatum]